MAINQNQQELVSLLANANRRRMAMDLKSFTGRDPKIPETSRQYLKSRMTIAGLKDKIAEQQLALAQGNYKAYMEASKSINEDKLKYAVQMQMNANNNRQRQESEVLKRMTGIEKELNGKLTSKVFSAVASLKKKNSITEASDPSYPDSYTAIQDGMSGVPVEDRMMYLDAVGNLYTPPVAGAQLMANIKSAMPQSRFVAELDEGEQAERRVHRDRNQMRNLYNRYANKTNEVGFAGGSFVKGFNPNSIEAHSKTPGAPRLESEILKEAEFQQASFTGDLASIMERSFQNPEFIRLMERNGFDPSSAKEKRKFFNLLRKGRVQGPPEIINAVQEESATEEDVFELSEEDKEFAKNMTMEDLEALADDVDLEDRDSLREYKAILKASNLKEMSPEDYRDTIADIDNQIGAMKGSPKTQKPAEAQDATLAASDAPSQVSAAEQVAQQAGMAETPAAVTEIDTSDTAKGISFADSTPVVEKDESQITIESDPAQMTAKQERIEKKLDRKNIGKRRAKALMRKRQSLQGAMT